MIEFLRNHIIARLGNDLDNLDYVLSTFKHITTKKKEQLLQQGDICKYVYFIAKGCLQVYVYDKDFNETTRDIVIEDNWCSELLSFGSGNPATENIRTVEPCELFAIDRQSFQTMMETVPQFAKSINKFLKHPTQILFIALIPLFHYQH